MPGQPIALSDDDLDHVSGGVDRLAPGLLAPDTTQPVDVLLLDIMAAMRDTELSDQKEKIAADRETKQAQLDERELKLEEAARKLEESKKGVSAPIEQQAVQWASAFMSTQVAALLTMGQPGNGLPNSDQFKALFDTVADKVAETLGKIDPNLATLVESQMEKIEAQLIAQLLAQQQKPDGVVQAGKVTVSSSVSDSAGSAGKVRA